MGIVSNTVQAVENAAADASAFIAQAVQGAINAQPVVAAPVAAPVAAVAPVVAATVTADPVALPSTGAAPEPVVAPVDVVAAVVAPETEAAVVAGTPLTKAEQLQGKIDTLQKRIAADTAKLAQLQGLFNAVDLLDGIKAGSVITAKVGRAETAKEVVATVVGVQTLDNGDKRFKIYFGEGFDADTVVIQESQIVDVKQV